MNRYGDPVPWSGPRAVLSFLNCTKYPPSLDFLLMTLGPALLALAWLDPSAARHPVTRWSSSDGRRCSTSSIHFYAIHLLAKAMALLRYGRPALSFLFQPVPSMGGPPSLYPPGFGYDLWVVYVVWAVVVSRDVSALSPLCANQGRSPRVVVELSLARGVLDYNSDVMRRFRPRSPRDLRAGCDGLQGRAAELVGPAHTQSHPAAADRRRPAWRDRLDGWQGLRRSRFAARSATATTSSPT